MNDPIGKRRDRLNGPSITDYDRQEGDGAGAKSWGRRALIAEGER
jgi:hypothetical protein